MKADWRKLGRGVFLVNVLAIIYDSKTKKILIGRREKDPYLKELTWCFPGGRPGYKKDLEDYLKKIIKEKTNLNLKIDRIVFAKTYPERRELLSVYYCTKYGGGKERVGGDLKELKWVRPTEVKKYFTTSLHPKLFEYLKTIG